MVDIAEIQEEIQRLESMEMNYNVASKLAILYSIFDRNNTKSASPQYKDIRSRSAESEFLDAVYDAPIDKSLTIINEHMQAIKALYPKEYAQICAKIKELQSEKEA